MLHGNKVLWILILPKAPKNGKRKIKYVQPAKFTVFIFETAYNNNRVNQMLKKF